MKAFKKHIFLFILILIGTFLTGKNVVLADIDWKGVTVECIYSDGGLYEYSFNDFSDEWSTNRYSYNLKGVDNSKSSTTSSIFYSKSGKPTKGTPPRCQPFVITSMYSEKDDTTVMFVKFSNSSTLTFDKTDFEGNWWQNIWRTTPLEKANDGEKSSYELVSENYILTDVAGEPDNVYNYKRENKKAEGEVAQAVSKPDYITILEFGSVKLAQSKNKTNYLGTFSKPEVACFTNADPKTYSGNNSTTAYYFESATIQYKSGSDTCSSGYYRYVYNGEGEAPNETDSGELCTKIMPKTAQDLALVIRWGQLLVPVLLIGLSAVDVGKIVMSGNIEEDLPKQKRKIITRFIVAVAFFFLPLIVMLLLDEVKIESGSAEEEISAIQQIKCIFEMV